VFFNRMQEQAARQSQAARTGGIRALIFRNVVSGPGSDSDATVDLNRPGPSSAGHSVVESSIMPHAALPVITSVYSEAVGASVRDSSSSSESELERITFVS
jgi:hypothetical protein